MGLCSSKKVTPAVRVWQTPAYKGKPNQLVCEITYKKDRYVLNLHNRLSIKFRNYMPAYKVQSYIEETIDDKMALEKHMYVETSWGYRSELFTEKKQAAVLQQRVLDKINMITPVKCMRGGYKAR